MDFFILFKGQDSSEHWKQSSAHSQVTHLLSSSVLLHLLWFHLQKMIRDNDVTSSSGSTSFVP